MLTLWRETKVLAAKEGKTPLIMLSEKNKAGQWMMCHTSDLDAVIVERLAAMDDDERDSVLKQLWTIRGVGG